MDSFVKSAMLRQNFKWSPLIGTSAMGDKTYGSATAFKGYQVVTKRLVTDNKGEQQISSTHIFIDAVHMSSIKEGDLIEVTDLLKTFPIIKVEIFYKEQGVLDYGVVYI